MAPGWLDAQLRSNQSGLLPRPGRQRHWLPEGDSRLAPATIARGSEAADRAAARPDQFAIRRRAARRAGVPPRVPPGRRRVLQPQPLALFLWRPALATPVYLDL